MSRKTDLGIYVKSTKTFYYLEYGTNYVSNTIDRIRKTLTQRNIITGIVDSNTREAQYEIVSYKKADESNLEMKAIFISRHVQALHEKGNDNSKQDKGTFK